MTKYNVTRKYPLETYGNVDLTAEELETIEEVREELKRLDEVAKEYKESEDKPSINLRCGNEYFVYNQKEGTLHKLEKKETIIKQEGEEMPKGNKAPF